MGTKPIDFSFNLKQNFMFAQTDAIKDIAIGNGNAKVLKIIPLSIETSGQYVTKDFDILDYHDLDCDYFQKLDFKLFAQSGSLLQTHESEEYNVTWLQLIFKKFPKNDVI